jgi:squalene synthase HpnD
MSAPAVVGLDDPVLAQLVTERTRAAGSSFYWGMRLLEPRRRLAMYAVYAFCREVDDIADGNASPADKVTGLDRWRAEIESVYAGRPAMALGHALVGPVTEFGLSREDFVAVIEGCAMDAREETCRPSEAILDLYCDRVACAVGRLSVAVFGAPGAEGTAVATALGRALQLTNILRDLREDAELGRLYLPDELLTAHGIDGCDPNAVLTHPALPEVCAVLAQRARTHFDAADRAMMACPRQAMRPARLMEAMYRDLLDRMESAHWQVTDARVRVPSAVKLWYVLRHGLF